MAPKRKEEEERKEEKISMSVIPQKKIKTKAEVQERLRGASSSSGYSPSSSSSEILDVCKYGGGSSAGNSSKNMGFFGLVEIAALATAEFNSLNILRESKNPKGKEKLCHATPLELPKPDRSIWCYLHRCMGGVDFHVFLFKRKLTKTDVNPSEARLFMNKKETEQVLLGALSKSEKKLVLDQSKGLEVDVIDHLGCQYKTCLKFWTTVRQFALFKEWRRLVEKNKLVAGDIINLWFFRHGVDLKLGFLITPGDVDDGGRETGASF